MLIINVGALHYITLLYTILFIEELEKWDIPKIDTIQKKVEAIELQQRKLFNAVIDMRYVHNFYKTTSNTLMILESLYALLSLH